jgi:hypothetical protein
MKRTYQSFLTTKEAFTDIPFLSDVEFNTVIMLIGKIQELKLANFQMNDRTAVKLLKILDCLVHYHIIFEKIFDCD